MIPLQDYTEVKYPNATSLRRSPTYYNGKNFHFIYISYASTPPHQFILLLLPISLLCRVEHVLRVCVSSPVSSLPQHQDPVCSQKTDQGAYIARDGVGLTGQRHRQPCLRTRRNCWGTSRHWRQPSHWSCWKVDAFGILVLISKVTILRFGLI